MTTYTVCLRATRYVETEFQVDARSADDARAKALTEATEGPGLFVWTQAGDDGDVSDIEVAGVETSDASVLADLHPRDVAVLRLYREANGRCWKAKLRAFWVMGDLDDYPALRRVRHVIGPSGLYRLPSDF